MHISRLANTVVDHERLCRGRGVVSRSRLSPAYADRVPILPLRRLADQIAHSPPRAGQTRVASIDGPAGSGKTTLAARLARLLDAPVVHMDDLFPGWDGLAEAPGKLVGWVLEPLAAGRQAAYRRYDWERGAYAERVAVPESDILIVEGCASGSGDAAQYLSLLIWVDAPHDVRMARGLVRDGETFAPHWERWARQENELFESERTRERADVIVDGDPEVRHDTESEIVTVSNFG